MKLSKIIVPVMAITLVFSANIAVTPTAEAACSYNGYINSGGACSKSFKKDNKKSNKSAVYQRTERADRVTNYSDIRQETLERFIELLREQIRRLEAQLDNSTNSNDDSEVSVTTRSVINIENDRATLRGRVDLNNEDEAEVYFEYGRTSSNLNQKTQSELIEDNDNDFDFSKTIRNLNNNATYYFRAVAEDEDGEKDRGSVLSFKTTGRSGNNNDDAPDVDTDSARNIQDDRAELRGSVDMNDFDNGIVFFVYGEDESSVEDVEDDYDKFNDIDEDGDDLQKVLLDRDLDDSASYRSVVSGLDDETDIYFSICVEYDDDDGDETISCGQIETFETDRN